MAWRASWVPGTSASRALAAYATAPPVKYADAPGRESREAARRPPDVHSLTATV
jgi:hypothetical protein